MSIHGQDTYILSTSEREQLLEPLQDHGHCWGAIATQILRDAVEERTRQWCENSRTKQHKWCGGKCVSCGKDHPTKLGSYDDRPSDGH